MYPTVRLTGARSLTETTKAQSEGAETRAEGSAQFPLGPWPRESGMHSYRTYIDEAGDEGFDFARGSSEWFVLGGFIVKTQDDLDVVKLLDRFRAQANIVPASVVHFRNLKEPRRRFLVNMISQEPRLCASVVAIHKPSVVTSTLPERDRMYFYATRLLVERLSWLCRDHSAQNPCDPIRLTFSHRTATAYADMRAYLQYLQGARTQIHWPAVDIPALECKAHALLRGLQLADAITSSFYKALRLDPKGQSDDQYARMLRGVVYQRGTSTRSYGLKMLPYNPPGLATEPRYGWIRTLYPR